MIKCKTFFIKVTVYLIKIYLFCFVFLNFSCRQSGAPSATIWPEMHSIHKPWTYWWWMGSAVDKINLTKNLELYHQAGLGGVHIIPIYGVKGYEDQFIDYLSPEWMDMLDHTTSEAARLGMGVDIATGTGWPFGGPNVTPESAVKKVVFQTYEVKVGEKLIEPIICKENVHRNLAGQHAPLVALMGFSNHGDIIDLSSKVDKKGRLNWQPESGVWELYAVFNAWSGMQVKRAAPGGEGHVVDYFSRSALNNYLQRFDLFFQNYKGKNIRAFYNDSYEVQSDWTNDFISHFYKRRGYDLLKHLPAFTGHANRETTARLKCDYRETVSDFLIEEYTIPWIEWCHEKGSIGRNQAHGMPANIIDSYAYSDIPETENWRFGHNKRTDVLGSKFASSAAHITGKSLVASETCTWLGEHFKVSLADVKTEVDKLFLSGVNHIFYHGIPYSPVDEQWPGWLFYATTHFGPTNTFWPDFPALNRYVARCQSFLQFGDSDNDILLYFPIHDIWHNPDGMLIKLAMSLAWFNGTPMRESAEKLWESGYSFDYVSDRLLMEFEFSDHKLRNGNSEYQTVIVPQCQFIPLSTFEKLIDLAREGATILFIHSLPNDVPGYFQLEKRRNDFNKLIDNLKFSESANGLQEAAIGKGRIVTSNNVSETLRTVGIRREPMIDFDLKMIRRQNKEGFHYFICNTGGNRINEWIELGVTATFVAIFDPYTDRVGKAFTRLKEGKTLVYLSLESGESLIIKTVNRKPDNGNTWRYWRPKSRAYEIKGAWSVEFVRGGPALPAPIEMKKLESWTLFGKDYGHFSGTAKYQIEFNKPEVEAEEWMLDLGKVAESAQVLINSHKVGTSISTPHHFMIGKYLKSGKNLLEVYVSNLMANRIAFMDREGISWKKFYDINIVNLHYQPFDASSWDISASGLLGPVVLRPCAGRKTPP